MIKSKKKPWPDRIDVDGETEQLLSIVYNGWAWQWPGWKWVAGSLNREFGNGRSASSCRNKFFRLEKADWKEAKRKKDDDGAEFYQEHSKNQYIG